MNVARNLGYVTVPEDKLVKPADLDDLPLHEQLILCTGSQGEPLSALTRIAYNDHPAIKVERGDTVIISARPVPGNELRVHDAINRLTKNGAEVLHEENADVHVSGHARAEELRTLLSLIRPKAVMPIHGEYRMQAAHARLAQDAGVPASSIVIAENGDVVELSRDGVRIADHIEAGVTFVDGLGIGDISDVALRDRRHMSEDGVLIVVTTIADGGASQPELITRGFAEDDELLEEMRQEAKGDRPGATRRRHDRDQAAAGAPARRSRPARLRPHAPAPDDPARGGGGMTLARLRSRMGGGDRRARSRGRDGTPTGRTAPGCRGRVARVLPPARAVGAGRCGPVDAGPPPGRTPPRSRSCRDGARWARTTARALPARARGRPGRGPIVVRRARQRRARRLGAGARSGGREGRRAPGRRGVSRACGARARRSKASRPRCAGTRRSIGAHCGPDCSTCGRTCSVARSTISARSPRRRVRLDLAGGKDAGEGDWQSAGQDYSGVCSRQ